MGIFISLFFLAAGHVAADQSGSEALSSWFNESKGRAIYRTVEDDLAAIFRDANATAIPQSLLLDRMNLAAARRLPPQRLVQGMHGELERLQTADEVISVVSQTASGRALLGPLGKAELLNTLSIYLSGGFSKEFLVSFLQDTASSGRPADEVFRACAVLLQLERVGSFTEAELASFGIALVTSSVAPTGYSAIGSFLVRAYLIGSRRTEILPVAVRILRQGGGLPQMELEFGRRR